MKWNKLEYCKWPKGMIVMRIDLQGVPQYDVGYINRSKTNQDVYFNSVKPLPSKISIDSIYDHEPYYIRLEDLEMPE